MFGRRRDRTGREPASSCEAFLQGRYAEHLDDRYYGVPTWAWMNLLAHGTEEQLRRAVDAVEPSRRGYAVWRRARSYLAGEVLNVARDASLLTAVQTDVLIPLELDLIASTRTDEVAPETWVTTVLAALERAGTSGPTLRGPELQGWE